MAQNGLTEDATGDLICCGYSVFVPGVGQTYRTNVPVPGYRRFQRNIPNMHRWNGATYIEVPQPAITTCHTSCAGDAMRAVIDSNEDSDQSAGNEHKWEVWDGHPDNGGVVAFKVSLVNNIVTLSTPMSGGISFGDVQIDSLGVGVAPNGVSGEAIFNARVIVGTVATPAAPIHVECQSDSEGIRLMRTGVPTQYLSISEGDFGEHLIEGYGNKHITIRNMSAQTVRFGTNGTLRWRIESAGHFVAVLDNAYDHGASGATRGRTMYLGTALNVGSPVVSTGVGHIRAGDGTRLLKWDAATGGLDVTGAGASLGVGAAATGNRGDAKFSDGTRTLQYNAGLGYLYHSGSQFIFGTNTNDNLVFFTNNINRIKIQADGRLAWMVDNSLDIGQSGAQRPATGYFGTSLNVGDGVTATTVNGSINAGDGTRILKWNAAAATFSIDGANSGIELTTEATIDRIRVGSGSGDTNARLLISRRGTTGTNLKLVDVYADFQYHTGLSTFNGTIWCSWTCGGMSQRVYLKNNGIQVWRLNSGAGEVGEIAYGTPGGVPGINFRSAALAERSDYVHLQGGSGGFKWSAHSTGGGPPTSAELLRLDGAAGAIFNQTGNVAFDLLVKGSTADVLFVNAGTDTLEARAQLALTGDISDSLAANQNNYNPAGLATAAVIRIALTANVILTGIAGGADGRILVLYNTDTVLTLTLNHEDAASTAANRIIGPGGLNKGIQQRGCAVLQYDSTSSRWRILSIT